jgi:hypothetical protein
MAAQVPDLVRKMDHFEQADGDAPPRFARRDARAEHLAPILLASLA